MNKIFTSFVMGMVCLTANTANAQFTQNFDSETPETLSQKCYSSNSLSTGSDKWIGLNLGSAGTTFTTPYLEPTSTNINVQFSYQSENFNGNRTMEIRFNNTVLTTLTLTTNNTTIYSVSLNTTLPNLLTYPQLSIRISGSAATTRMIYIDDIVITGLSNKTYCNPPTPTILPIHFMSFSGNANDNKAQLTWNVADNETGSHFEVEKSTDGKKYQPVATVMTSSIVGTEKYNYTDAAFATSGSFYRIKVINKDHSTSYSKTVYIKGTSTMDNKLTLMQNPVKSALNFSFTSATDETAEVAIYNLAGVKMHSQQVVARKGTNSISLGMDSKYNKGTYILTVQSASASRSIQLIKQ